MDITKPYELHLSFITTAERLVNPETFDYEYAPYVLQMLELEGKHIFEEDVLTMRAGTRQYESEMSLLDEILSDTPDLISKKSRYPNPHQQGKICYPVYYDLSSNIIIEPQYIYYDRFFAYLMKHTTLMNIDACLSYQLETHHNNNLPFFARFLHLTIRQYKEKILSEETILTIVEWIAAQEKKASVGELNGNGKDNYKGKQNGIPKRSANDKLTCLNQQQTILLIHYLQKNRAFLKDEYLTAADAGKAFELLTGYSQHTIRQDLGKHFQFDNNENKESLRALLNKILTDMSK
jgi:hypothetical protein